MDAMLTTNIFRTQLQDKNDHEMILIVRKQKIDNNSIDP